MKTELFIARRYMASKRKTGFISLVSYISISGVVIGVAALIIVLSVMNGFEAEVRSRFLSADAHIHVRTVHESGMKNYGFISDQIRALRGVNTVSPYIENKGLVKSRAAQAGIIIRGIETESAKEVVELEKNLIYGTLNLDPMPYEGNPAQPGIILGFELSKRLQVIVGDEVTLISLSGVRTLQDTPMMRKFRVVGYFETGLYEFDDNLAYISLPSAQKLFKLGENVSGIWVKLHDFDQAGKYAKRIQAKLGPPYEAISWRELNPNLFAWMEIEKWAAFVVLSLIITVAAFNIISTLIMVTMEKTREIGILKSMGADADCIRRIFTLQGAIVGVIGTLIGIAIGVGFCLAQDHFKFFSLPQVYIVGWLPVLIKWTDVALIGIVAIVITFVSAVYPAAKAAKLDPVAAIRYE